MGSDSNRENDDELTFLPDERWEDFIIASFEG